MQTIKVQERNPANVEHISSAATAKHRVIIVSAMGKGVAGCKVSMYSAHMPNSSEVFMKSVGILYSAPSLEIEAEDFIGVTILQAFGVIRVKQITELGTSVTKR